MILTWYIFRQTLSNVLISTLVFVGIIWLSQSFKTIKLIINKGAGLFEFFILSAYSFPSWLLIALPFGTFAGCMISYSKLQTDKEIIVMKSAGINPLNLSKPALIIAILVLGPKEFPIALKKIGSYIGKAKNTLSSFQKEVSSVTKDVDLDEKISSTDKKTQKNTEKNG